VDRVRWTGGVLESMGTAGGADIGHGGTLPAHDTWALGLTELTGGAKGDEGDEAVPEGRSPEHK
jgi:hypothetical protein